MLFSTVVLASAWILSYKCFHVLLSFTCVLSVVYACSCCLSCLIAFWISLGFLIVSTTLSKISSRSTLFPLIISNTTFSVYSACFNCDCIKSKVYCKSVIFELTAFKFSLHKRTRLFARTRESLNASFILLYTSRTLRKIICFSSETFLISFSIICISFSYNLTCSSVSLIILVCSVNKLS